MFKTLLVGIGGGFLGLAGAAAIPVIVAILGAFGGATAIVGIGAWRSLKRARRDSDQALVRARAGVQG